MDTDTLSPLEEQGLGQHGLGQHGPASAPAYNEVYAGSRCNRGSLDSLVAAALPEEAVKLPSQSSTGEAHHHDCERDHLERASRPIQSLAAATIATDSVSALAPPTQHHHPDALGHHRSHDDDAIAATENPTTQPHVRENEFAAPSNEANQSAEADSDRLAKDPKYMLIAMSLVEAQSKALLGGVGNPGQKMDAGARLTTEYVCALSVPFFALAYC